AWIEHDRERIKILAAELSEAHGAPGQVLDDKLTIACKHGAVRALNVQRAGKASADAAAFLRGYALPKGTTVA
ncbi:MAG: methionyl-tRNA formyltransferase, partial [Rhodospirillaceae bacterium]